mmetsp:Transcript_5278/g.11129  ORF Transcript_5278/g.11129 Transcript_5278/m.11129 type:complete len:239 (+) Transcript_5278:135-851(+)
MSRQDAKKKEERDPPQDEEMPRFFPDEIGGGIRPIFISDAHATHMGLKNGPQLVDLVGWKTFNTQQVLSQIQELGCMCPFEPYGAILNKCTLEEFLIICDPSAKHGEKFLLFHIEAFHKYPAYTRTKVDAESRAEKEKLDELKAAAQVLLDAIFVDEPAMSTASAPTTFEEAPASVLATESSTETATTASVLATEPSAATATTTTTTRRLEWLDATVQTSPGIVGTGWARTNNLASRR